MLDKVLIVDDDREIIQILRKYFEAASFEVFCAYDGAAALLKFAEVKPSLVVLDIMMPELDGHAVCRAIRAVDSVPIIILSARDAEDDKLMGLELGADDYVSKPFSPREVVARAKAVVRRSQMKTRGNETQILHSGVIFLNVTEHRLLVAGNNVELTATEMKILGLFLRSQRRVFTREQILEAVQGYTFEGYERVIDAHVKNIRRKIGDGERGEKYLRTVYGMGYKWEEPDAE